MINDDERRWKPVMDGRVRHNGKSWFPAYASTLNDLFAPASIIDDPCDEWQTAVNEWYWIKLKRWVNTHYEAMRGHDVRYFVADDAAFIGYDEGYEI